MTTQGYLSISFFQEGLIGLRKTFSCIFFTTIITISLICLFACIFKPILNQYLIFPWEYLYLAISTAFFIIYSNMCLDYFRIKKNVKYYGLFSCGSAILIFATSIFFVKFLLMGWFGCILAQLICSALFGTIGIIVFLQKKCISFPDITHWKLVLMWGIPLIPHLATDFIQQGCDRYIINHYFDAEQVGLFSFAYTLSAAIIMIGSGFNEANSVSVFEILGNKKMQASQKMILLKKQKKNLFWVYLASTIVAILLCIVLVPFVMPQYSLSVKYFVVLSIYALGQCIYFLYGIFLSFYNQTKKLMSITFSFAIIHFVSSLFLTQYSIYYTCLIYVVCQFGIIIFIRKNAIMAIEENLNCKVGLF